jgi:phosphoribosyl-ATP pyrophosphohydrolase
MSDDSILSRLEQTIASRRGGDPASSYVAKLNAKGLPKITQKLGEEATEAVIAALVGTTDELVGEAADVLFHLMVLLDAKGIQLATVLAELERREGTSGIDEKASRATEELTTPADNRCVCGAKVPDGATNCPKCGYQLVQEG